ncbi:MAG TPA: RND transporter [Gammaproteobacteria bacterium]|nr:RND transporter [Gammaproteobacteria bacterium]
MITRWLAKIPLGPLILAAIFMALAPFRPEPHLWQKLTMLANGELHRAVDIFDLFWHSALIVLVLLKLTLGKRASLSD